MSDLGTRLRDRIRQDGPLRFRDWMEACLYDPDDGYYMRPGRKTGPGLDADFATSPTLHPFMARAVAQEAADSWERLDGPDGFTVVEYGGGEGDLARDALATIDADHPELGACIAWIHVEISPTHRDAQADADPRIQHATQPPAGFNGLVVAHEFVDALPFHVLEWRKGNWAEVFVEADDVHGFTELYGIPSRSAVEAAPKRSFLEGQRVVAMADAQSWLADVTDSMGQGRILIIDYGDRGRRLWVPERTDASVRGFRDQMIVDPLHEPAGGCDITANVDFTQLEQWATFDGFRPHELESQEAFLMRHGALEALATAPKETVEDASAYLRLKQLVMPQAMGSAFKVLRMDRGLGAPVPE